MDDLFVFERLERRSCAQLEVRRKVGQIDAAVNRREQTVTNMVSKHRDPLRSLLNDAAFGGTGYCYDIWRERCSVNREKDGG